MVHNRKVRTVGASGEHTGVEASCAKTPAMQKEKVAAAGIENEDVEVVLGRADVAARIGYRRHLGQADDSLAPAGHSR